MGVGTAREPAPAALSGVRVLDLATLFPAPMVAAMLGDLGADVVKVEPPSGDALRVTGAMPRRPFVRLGARRAQQARDRARLRHRRRARPSAPPHGRRRRRRAQPTSPRPGAVAVHVRRHRCAQRGCGRRRRERLRRRRSVRGPGRERHGARGLRRAHAHDRRRRRAAGTRLGADRRLSRRLLRCLRRARGAVLARRERRDRPARRREHLRGGAPVPRSRDGGVVTGRRTARAHGQPHPGPRPLATSTARATGAGS